MINQLIANIKKTGAPVVAGLDPMMKFIPEHIQKKAFDKYGESLEGAAAAVWWFNKEIVDNIYDIIPAVKPQIAMYEQFGIPGLMAYKKTIEYCKDKGLVVIGDIKRGDIGSTSEAYAVAHLGKVKVGSKSFYSFMKILRRSIPTLALTGSILLLKCVRKKIKESLCWSRPQIPAAVSSRTVWCRQGSMPEQKEKTEPDWETDLFTK